jgi:hypothetical protein
MHDDAQSPGLSLVKKNRAPPTGGTLKEGERVKERKEKGLLLHPPFAKVTSQAQQRP